MLQGLSAHHEMVTEALVFDPQTPTSSSLLQVLQRFWRQNGEWSGATALRAAATAVLPEVGLFLLTLTPSSGPLGRVAFDLPFQATEHTRSSGAVMEAPCPHFAALFLDLMNVMGGCATVPLGFWQFAPYIVTRLFTAGFLFAFHTHWFICASKTHSEAACC